MIEIRYEKITSHSYLHAHISIVKISVRLQLSSYYKIAWIKHENDIHTRSPLSPKDPCSPYSPKSPIRPGGPKIQFV